MYSVCAFKLNGLNEATLSITRKVGINRGRNGKATPHLSRNSLEINRVVFQSFNEFAGISMVLLIGILAKSVLDV